MILKPIEHISRDDIYRLLEAAAPETRTLEYKREIPGASDGDKVKFLKAVSGMANTDGGDVIYGIEAKDGIPTAITGFPQNQVDQTKLRLEGLLASCVEPRIPSVVLHTVSIDETNCVLIARSRRSWLAPHRITVSNHVHFYGRNSASTFQMDVSQLRNAFLLSDQHADQVRAFVVNRLLRIEQQRSPVKLIYGAKVVLHVLPVASLSRQAAHQILVPKFERTRFPIAYGPQSQSQKPNLDGFVVFNTRNGPCESYTQVFRSGAVEFVAVFGENHISGRNLPGAWIEELILGGLESIVKELVNRDVPAPYVISLSFMDVEGYELERHGFKRNQPANYPETMLILPDVFIDEPLSFNSWKVMRPVLDAMWNAFEYEGSPYFDEQGNWKLP